MNTEINYTPPVITTTHVGRIDILTTADEHKHPLAFVLFTKVLIPIEGQQELKDCRMGVTRKITLEPSLEFKAQVEREIINGTEWLNRKLQEAVRELKVVYRASEGKEGETFKIDATRLKEIKIVTPTEEESITAKSKFMENYPQALNILLGKKD